MNFKKIIVPVIAFLALVGIGFIVYYSNPNNRPMKPYDVPQYYTFKRVVEEKGYVVLETNFAEMSNYLTGMNVTQTLSEMTGTEYKPGGLQAIYCAVSKSVKDNPNITNLDTGLPFELDYREYSSFDAAKAFYSNGAINATAIEEGSIVKNGQIRNELDEENKKGFVIIQGDVNHNVSDKSALNFGILTGIDIEMIDYYYCVMCISDNRVCYACTTDRSAVPELQSMLEEMEMPIPSGS